MKYDFNLLEKRAREFLEEGNPGNALKIYFFMADGDQSLDGGYLGERIARCYQQMNDLHAAKYWYGRAVEENPHVRTASAEARKKLDHVTIDDLIAREK
jgi:flavodoxin